MLAKKKAC